MLLLLSTPPAGALHVTTHTGSLTADRLMASGTKPLGDRLLRLPHRRRTDRHRWARRPRGSDPPGGLDAVPYVGFTYCQPTCQAVVSAGTRRGRELVEQSAEDWEDYEKSGQFALGDGLVALLDQVFLDTVPIAPRLLQLLEERGWTGWTRLERRG